MRRAMPVRDRRGLLRLVMLRDHFAREVGEIDFDLQRGGVAQTVARRDLGGVLLAEFTKGRQRPRRAFAAALRPCAFWDTCSGREE